MERVLNVSVGERHKIYPFSAFNKTPIINDQVGDLPVVVFSRRGTLSVLDREKITEARTIPSATAFNRRLAGRTLTFTNRADKIVDQETGTHWDLLGNAVAGPLKGHRLKSVESGVHFAFAWLAFNPNSEIYRIRGKNAER